MKSLKKLFILLVVIGLIGAVVFYFRDTTEPQLTLTPNSGPISHKSKLLLSLTDAGSGLKDLQVIMVQKNNRMPLLEQSFPATTETTDIELDLGKVKLEEGDFQIEVQATDSAIYHFGKGNQASKTFSLTYDSRPPIISILSKAHNFTRGGSGLVVFSVNEEVKQAGIQFGDLFFQAFRQPSGHYACLFVYPYFMPEKDFVPRVVAQDLAGNERQTGIYYRAKYKRFRDRDIKISKSFLDMKTPELEPLAPNAKTPIDIFLYVNREVRKANRAKMAELSKDTSPTPLWKNSFLRQPKAATLAQFADHRTYYYEGKKIDEAYHLGYDLASVAQAEIEAANDGKVVWAEYLGIYGLCVVIDHGLGLQTLYAHMSQLDVHPGDQVSRGQIIGRSGATGMAGGDHLHFGVFVSGIPVQPVEWWDQHWLTDNIDSKLQL